MTKTGLRIYGTTWCGDCIRARRFLDEHGIPYNFINIDQDKKAEQAVIQINKGNRSVPTIFFTDGTILVEPSNHMLANKLGIKIYTSRFPRKIPTPFAR